MEVYLDQLKGQVVSCGVWYLVLCGADTGFTVQTRRQCFVMFDAGKVCEPCERLYDTLDALSECSCPLLPGSRVLLQIPLQEKGEKVFWHCNMLGDLFFGAQAPRKKRFS